MVGVRSVSGTAPPQRQPERPLLTCWLFPVALLVPFPAPRRICRTSSGARRRSTPSWTVVSCASRWFAGLQKSANVNWSLIHCADGSLAGEGRPRRRRPGHYVQPAPAAPHTSTVWPDADVF